MKTIFRNTSASLLHCLFYLFLSLLLMIADDRSQTFHQARDQAEVVVTPVRMMVSFPVHLYRWLVSNISSQQALVEDNATLRAQQQLLQAKLHHMLALERENNQLKGLLHSTDAIQGEVKVAQLLSIDLDPSLNQIMLNKGSTYGVTLGQPVLDAYGILGQVIGVTAHTSKVLLVSDEQFAIPVLDQRSGVRAVAVGLGHSKHMRLINQVGESDIKAGDLFVSSGYGLRFPAGYPVGQVVTVQPVSGSQHTEVTLSILAHINRSEQVLLAWPDQHSQLSSDTVIKESHHDHQ